MKNFLSFVFKRKLSIIFLIFLVSLASFIESISFSSLPIALRVILNSQEPPRLFSNVENLKFLDNLIARLFFNVEPHLAIMRIAILTFFIFLLKFLVLFLKDIITTIIEEKMMIEIRNKMFSKLLSIPTYWINTHNSGEIISRFTNDIRLLKGSLTEGIFEFLFSLVKLVIYVSILVIIAFNLLLFGILIAIPLGLLLFLISKAMNYRWNKLNQNISQMGSYIGSIVRGIKVIKIFSSRNNEISKFEKLSKNYFNAVLKLEALGSFSSNFSEFIVSIPIILFLIYVSNLVFLRSQLTGDQFIVFLLLVISSISPIKRIFKANNHIQRGISIYNRILEFLSLPDEPKGGQIIFEKLKEKIEVVNVSFYYGNKIILDNISFTIRKGEKVGIVGLSGAGKTTLIEILAGFLKPSSGKILIDGIDLWNYNIESYRSKISFVPQEPFLFEGTIYENLTFSKNISLEEVRRACNLANISEFIESLESGYFYRVSEGGANLSGGQKQRLTIARAILKNPEIIFLDEPTSNLDAQSEEKIINAIKSFLFDKTAIIITHRISTILFVDKIIVMKNGRILDIGKHEELIDRCEVYRNLVEIQTIS